MAEASGAPTAEDRARYETLKKELMQSLPKKRAIDKQLALVEVNIYNMEASYLTETAGHSGGNIIQGFENYLKNQAAARKKYEVHDHDRVFSNSSLTYQKSLELLGEGEMSSATNDEYVKQSTPAPLTTIAVPPARNQEVSASRKTKDREYQRRKRGTTSHRSGDSDDDIVSAASVTSSRRPYKRARMATDED